VVKGVLQFDDRAVALSLGAVALMEGGAQLDQIPSQLKLRLNLSAQCDQRRLLIWSERTGDNVHHAQRAQRMSVGAGERRAGVEMNLGIRHNERIRTEPGIFAGVGNNEEIRLLDGDGAE
jgi:hypothetical protein